MSINVDTQNVCFWIFYISILQGYTHLKRVTFSSGSSHWTLSDRNMIDLVIFRAYWLKTTYMLECPARVDSQSPVRESQILMVPSRLALAICFPSGLHATDSTLYLWEVSTRIKRTTDENLKKTYKCECPVSVDWQSPDCESQILMVLSPLPLAICFPSGLHATE